MFGNNSIYRERENYPLAVCVELENYPHQLFQGKLLQWMKMVLDQRLWKWCHFCWIVDTYFGLVFWWQWLLLPAPSVSLLHELLLGILKMPKGQTKDAWSYYVGCLLPVQKHSQSEWFIVLFLTWNLQDYRYWFHILYGDICDNLLDIGCYKKTYNYLLFPESTK